MVDFCQGDVVLADLNPVKGHEQGNQRPLVVMNTVPMPGNCCIVLPVTFHEKTYPFQIELVGYDFVHGYVLCFQPRTLDLEIRSAKKIGRLNESDINKC